MTHVITLNRVTKRFRDQLALDDVTLHVPRGVVFALLGENGAGKSTLNKVMTGVVAPDEGSMTMDGGTVTFRSPAEAAKVQKRRLFSRA